MLPTRIVNLEIVASVLAEDLRVVTLQQHDDGIAQVVICHGIPMPSRIFIWALTRQFVAANNTLGCDGAEAKLREFWKSLDVPNEAKSIWNVLDVVRKHTIDQRLTYPETLSLLRDFDDLLAESLKEPTRVEQLPMSWDVFWMNGSKECYALEFTSTSTQISE